MADIYFKRQQKLCSVVNTWSSVKDLQQNTVIFDETLKKLCDVFTKIIFEFTYSKTCECTGRCCTEFTLSLHIYRPQLFATTVEREHICLILKCFCL